MGSDFIKYARHHEMFNDFDLWTLRHFFIEEAKKLQTDEPNEDVNGLREFFEKWDWLGPGVFIGTDLNEYVLGSRRRWELLLTVLQKAADRLAEFGELIPLEYLTAHVSTKTSYFTKAQPVRPYFQSIGRICTLLSKERPND
jgi:hypothetical protein